MAWAVRLVQLHTRMVTYWNERQINWITYPKDSHNGCQEKGELRFRFDQQRISRARLEARLKAVCVHCH